MPLRVAICVRPRRRARLTSTCRTGCFHRYRRRQIPDCRQIERLVECTFVGRAVSKKVRHTLSCCCIWMLSPTPVDNGMPPATMPFAPDSARDIGDVHRPAASATVADFFAEEFGHHQLWLCAFADAVTVSAMGAEDVIVGCSARHDPTADASCQLTGASCREFCPARRAILLFLQRGGSDAFCAMLRARSHCLIRFLSVSFPW